MQQYPIARVSGHLLAIFGEERWLLDTGSPVSFGRSRSLELDGQRFAIAREALGLDAGCLRISSGSAFLSLGSRASSATSYALDAGWVTSRAAA